MLNIILDNLAALVSKEKQREEAECNINIIGENHIMENEDLEYKACIICFLINIYVFKSCDVFFFLKIIPNCQSKKTSYTSGSYIILLMIVSYY